MGDRLAGKVAFITGAARGQGLSEATRFVSEGATVYIADVLDDAGMAAADELKATGGSAHYLHLDVTSEDEWASAVEHVISAEGHIDVLVNNAGIVGRGSVITTTLEYWERVLSVNLTGGFLGIKTVAPVMKEAGRGSIVNIVSMASMSGYPGAAYAASKWAFRGLSQSAALELAGWGVRVNAVHPGLVDTPMVTNEHHNSLMVGYTPLGRVASVDEVASLVLFLASDESAYMTGADLVIDGGFLAGAALRKVGLETGVFVDPT